MHPILIRLGPLTIHTYGFLIAVGFLVGIWLALLQARKEGISSDRIVDLSFYILLAAIIGSRVLFVAVNYSHYMENPVDVFKIWEGGLVFYGGVLFAVPTAVWYVKKNGMGVWSTADIFAPSIAVGHVFGRLGCLAAGCCFGKTAQSLPWGIVFSDPDCLAPTNVLLHPTQLYESAGELTNFLILITLRRYKSFDGQVFMTYLLLYSVLRFIVEFFRGDVGRGFFIDGLSVSQGISIIMFLVAVAGFLVLKSKRRAAELHKD
jgi:phosphatidylglycerol:prolipoprotein diacylglycerol transferase